MKSRNSINDHNVDADEKNSFTASDCSISVVVVRRNLWQAAISVASAAQHLLAAGVSLQQ